jgi:DHA2 family metal-tetracycline-proton antiporter-like MFS transporter/DHA2 family florfenicol/chloramphenicol resistance protein-like MFS transporter
VLLVDVNGLSPGEGALVMIPAGLAVAVLSPLIGGIADRIGTRPLVLTGLGLMGLFTLFLSAFAGGTSVIPAGAGMLGLSVGFIFVLTPIISAATGALPTDQIGVGLGILQGAQFLGAGTGPALFGVLVTARQQGGSEAVNPLYAGDAAAFSDVFLVMALVVVLASVAAFRMRPAAASPVPPAVAVRNDG